MKEWYQYRCEEVGIHGVGLVNFFNTVVPIAGVLKKYLFMRLLDGGLLWEYPCDFSDWVWRQGCITGVECENKNGTDSSR